MDPAQVFQGVVQQVATPFRLSNLLVRARHGRLQEYLYAELLDQVSADWKLQLAVPGNSFWVLQSR